MFRALLCPSSEARYHNVDYHIGRFVLGLLYVGGWVRLGCSSVRAAARRHLVGFHFSVVKMFMKLIDVTYGLLWNWESDNICCSTHTQILCWGKFS